MKRYFRCFVLVMKMSYMAAAEYRTSYYLRMVRIVLENVISIFTIETIFGKTDNIAGWDKGEVFMVFAIWSLSVSILYFFISNSLYRTSRDIRVGAIDMLLVKPIDSQFLASFRDVHVHNIVRIFTSILIFVYAIQYLRLDLELSNVLLFILHLIASIIITYSLMFLAVVVTFATQGNEQLSLMDNLTFMGRYPLDIFGRKTSLILTTIFPLAMISTIPARTVLGESKGIYGWSIFVVAGVFFVLARRSWFFALKKYTSVSG